MGPATTVHSLIHLTRHLILP